jgi:NADH-quinone oxidoreductase subunit L
MKRVIAYSTVSQLGYMMLALGVGSFSAGIFHLYNHAFFKALLFLGAGSIIYAMNSYNIFEMGGLRRRMPLTFWTMVIAGLSLSGIFPLSGFWSKDEIVGSTFAEHFYVLFVMALLTVFLTAFYIFRAIFVAFTGEPRTEAAREAVESPGIMTGPMVILALLSAVSGFVGTPINNYFAQLVAPSEFAISTLSQEQETFNFVLAAISVAVAIGGIALAYALYVPKPERATELSRRFPRLYAFLDKGWYFDAIYGAIFVRPAMAIGRGVREFDRQDLGRFVSGVGRASLRLGERLSPLQSGGVQNYALFILVSVLILGVIVGAEWPFLIVALIATIALTAVAVGARL